ncbi:MAG TPA: hypothetical protein VL172_10560, partial [Kofleriaceae bacterium]|nr:hypothetical protein [Kofleriaceae bacterium]
FIHKIGVAAKEAREARYWIALIQESGWASNIADLHEEARALAAILALLGFATWIGGGLLFALRGITPEDRLVRRTAAIAGIAVAAGLLVWMTGLYYA